MVFAVIVGAKRFGEDILQTPTNSILVESLRACHVTLRCLLGFANHEPRNQYSGTSKVAKPQLIDFQRKSSIPAAFVLQHFVLKQSFSRQTRLS